MSELSIGQTAQLLGVSTDTVRRLVDDGALTARRSPGGHRVIDGASVAEHLTSGPGASREVGSSVRNRLLGIVTRVVRDRVTAQVDVRSGPHRLVSVITREAADELELEPGSLVVAAVKATNVTIERPR